MTVTIATATEILTEPSSMRQNDGNITTQSITLDMSRGEILFSDPNGNACYDVIVDGPIRGRELVWAERADGTHRVIPATEWRNFINA